MRCPSFKAFLGLVLQDRGFIPGPHQHWYRVVGNSVIAVSLHNKWYDKGVYIEYGIAFFETVPRRLPKTDECAVFGDNPALPPPRFRRFKLLLKNVNAARTDPLVQDQITAGIDEQLRCLMVWTNKEKLIKRVQSRRFLDMLVNRKALGLPNGFG